MQTNKIVMEQIKKIAGYERLVPDYQGIPRPEDPGGRVTGPVRPLSRRDGAVLTPVPRHAMDGNPESVSRPDNPLPRGMRSHG